MRRGFSLKVKLILSVLGAVFLFGGLATFAVHSFTQNALIEDARIDLEQIAVEKSQQVGYIFFIASELTEKIAEQELIIDYLDGPRVEQDAEVLTFLSGYNIDDAFSAIYLMDVEGYTWTSTQESFVGKNYDFRNYFQRAVEGEAFLDAAIGVTSGELGYYFSHPVENEEGEVLGVLVAKMKPVTVSETIRESALSEGANIMFVDQFGVVLYSLDEDRIFQSLGPLSQSDLEEIEEIRRYEDMDISALDYNEVKIELNYLDEAKTYEIFHEEGEIEEIVSAVPVNGTEFSLLIEENLAVHTAPAARVAIVLSVFVSFGAVFASLIIVFVLLSFLRPLKQVESFANKMAGGDLSQRLIVKTGDEFEQLAENLNVMAKSLQDAYENVEEKVKERTVELEKLTKFMNDRELKMIELKKQLRGNLTEKTDEN